MKESAYYSREDLSPMTPEQEKLKSNIEINAQEITPKNYDKFVMSRKRDEVAISCQELLKRTLNPDKIYTTLDVGAGTGILTNRLGELANLNVFALDARQDFLDYAILNKRMKKNQAMVGDFNELPFKDNCFDLYAGLAILNQRENIDKFYSEALRVLKKRGLLFLPWVKVKAGSIEREKNYFKKMSIKILNEGDWFLIGEK